VGRRRVKIVAALSRDKPYIAPAVRARIAGAHGWPARAAGNQEMVKADVHAIRQHLASADRDPDVDCRPDRREF